MKELSDTAAELKKSVAYKVIGVYLLGTELLLGSGVMDFIEGFKQVVGHLFKL